MDDDSYIREDLFFYIQVGTVVGQVNSVEMYINGIISAYYARSDERSHIVFTSDILNGLVTLDSKISLIKKIALGVELGFSRQNKSDLYKWKEIRNIVAHGVPINTVTDGKNHMILWYNDTMYEIENLRDEFYQRQTRLTDYLKSIQDTITRLNSDK